MKILLAATGGFAIPTLESLTSWVSKENLLVISQPDRQRGRGRRQLPTPIKKQALKLDLTVITPDNLNQPRLWQELTNFTPDYLVVVDYGRIIPLTLITLPRKAAINIHPSLLPAYRGPAPMIWCILNGEEKTGVTTQLVAEKVDTGDILLQTEFPLPPQITLVEMENKLSLMGANLLRQTIEQYHAGHLKPRPQDDNLASYAPKLDKSEGRLDWQQPAVNLERRIRALNPRPGTYTFWQGKRLKILAAVLPADKPLVLPELSPGTIMVEKDLLLVVCGTGSLLQITRLQAENKPPREAADFIHGNRLKTGFRFTNKHQD